MSCARSLSKLSAIFDYLAVTKRPLQLKDRRFHRLILLTQRRPLRQMRLNQADAEDTDGVGARGGQGEGGGNKITVSD